MFTGIVNHLGTVRAASGTMDRTLLIAPNFDPATLTLGASVAHSGVCLTVVEAAGETYQVELSGETLSRTTAGDWTAGTRLNLERSLRLGDELGGHLVFGHVDAVAEILSIEAVGESHRFVFGVPAAMAPLLAVKGSVAVDGISLTVTEATATAFACVVLPWSRAATTLALRRPGDRVNLEADMLARYVARQLGSRQPGSPEAAGHAG